MRASSATRSWGYWQRNNNNGITHVNFTEKRGWTSNVYPFHFVKRSVSLHFYIHRDVQTEGMSIMDLECRYRLA